MIQLTHIQSPETIDKLLKGNASYPVMAPFRRVWGKQKFSRVDLNPSRNCLPRPGTDEDQGAHFDPPEPKTSLSNMLRESEQKLVSPLLPSSGLACNAKQSKHVEHVQKDNHGDRYAEQPQQNAAHGMSPFRFHIRLEPRALDSQFRAVPISTEAS
jgi:hypothetical protein